MKILRLLLSRSACAAWLGFLDLLLVVNLLVMFLAGLLDPLKFSMGPMHLTVHGGLKPVLALVIIFGVRQLLARVFARQHPSVRGLWESAVFKKTCFALITTYVFFALLESVLAWTKFNVDLPPIVFEGRNSTGGIEKPETVSDAALIYRFKPGSDFAARRINSLGFRDREVDPRKKPGAIRVICMGDSVTGQGRPGYSQYLHERLTNNPPAPGNWEAFNMGVHGYSSLQGLRLFQRQGRSLAPDIVTLYYGWNDHWLTKVPDRQLMGMEMRPFAGRVFEMLRHKRTFRLVVWALNPLQHVATQKRGNGRVLRVEPNEYRSTLKAFVYEIRQAGAVPVIITAPRRSLTDEVINQEYVETVEQGNRTHDEYVEITRQVARESNVEMVDLAAIFTNQACDSYFARDGIHFDAYAKEGLLDLDIPQPGLMRIAEELDRKVREITRTPEWQAHRMSPR